MNNLLITICARGGSKGVKNKNTRQLAGHPLIYYTIKQAKEWARGKHTVVSTDSQEIAQIAKQYGAETPFIRPAALARDTTPTLPVVRHALKSCEEIYKEKYDFVMDLAVTAPVRKVNDLEKALNLFLKEKPQTLFSVVPAQRNPYFNMIELDKEGRAHYCKPNKNFSRRQDAPPVYDMNASIYIYDRKYLLDEKNNQPVSNHSIIYIMDERSRIDIDSEIDFKFVESLIKESVISL